MYEPNPPTPSGKNIRGIYDIFTRCTIRNQFDNLPTIVADVRKGKQTCHTKVSTKQSMRDQVFLDETCYIPASNTTTTKFRPNYIVIQEQK